MDPHRCLRFLCGVLILSTVGSGQLGSAAQIGPTVAVNSALPAPSGTYSLDHQGAGLIDSSRADPFSPGAKVQFVTVEPDVRLEVLDWGGSGRPLIFLAGNGDTAHASTALHRSLPAGTMSTALPAGASARPASRRRRTGTTRRIAWETMSSLSCKHFGSSVLFWWGTRLQVRS